MNIFEHGFDTVKVIIYSAHD